MRAAIAILGFASLSSAAFAQAFSQTLETIFQVRTLTIASSDLPDSERRPIVSAYQGKTEDLEELEERIRLDLRDLGYAHAAVEDGQIANLTGPPDSRSADVSVRVFPGAKYQVEAIRFTGAKAFSPDQLRSQFPIADGSLFNASAIGKGLDNLKNLYASQGYINFGAIPKLSYDESRHTISLDIDIDEGARYVFGRLFLDGVEPHAGASKELLAAWSSMEGKTYDPKLLTNWLAVNATFLPGVAAAPETAQEKYVTVHDDENRRLDIVLHLP